MCHGRLVNGEDFDMVSWTLTVGRWMGWDGVLAHQGTGQANWCTCARLWTRRLKQTWFCTHTHIHTLPVDLFYHIIMAGGGSAGGGGGVYCVKAEKMSWSRREGGKEDGRMRTLPADNEIKPISVEWNNREEEVTAGLQHTQLYCL